MEISGVSAKNMEARKLYALKRELIKNFQIDEEVLNLFCAPRFKIPLGNTPEI